MQQKGLDTRDSVVLDVVEAIAETTGKDVLSLDPPLNEVIDADALDRLVNAHALTEVTFEYDGHTVVVDGDGGVTITEPIAIEGDRAVRGY